MNIQSGIAHINNTQLYYETAGSGMPVVFVHGWLLDTRMWDDQFELFAKRFQVIRSDCRGFGRSQLPTTEYSHAEDLKALLEQLGVKRACVVGLSNGGRIAINFAVLHLQMAIALAVANTTLEGYIGEELGNSVAPIGQHASIAGGTAANEMLLNHVIFAPTHKKPVAMAKVSKIIRDSPDWQWTHHDPNREHMPPAIERLTEIQIPVLIIVGEQDMRDFHAIREILESKLPYARVLHIADAGHMCNMESPDQFNRETIAFLKEVSR